jgi:hypothetical protein
LDVGGPRLRRVDASRSRTRRSLDGHPGGTFLIRKGYG